jgi:hypothetical protein
MPRRVRVPERDDGAAVALVADAEQIHGRLLALVQPVLDRL